MVLPDQYEIPLKCIYVLLLSRHSCLHWHQLGLKINTLFTWLFFDKSNFIFQKANTTPEIVKAASSKWQVCSYWCYCCVHHINTTLNVDCPDKYNDFAVRKPSLKANGSLYSEELIFPKRGSGLCPQLPGGDP